jgi:Transposase IS116/IS110/IS902 family
VHSTGSNQTSHSMRSSLARRDDAYFVVERFNKPQRGIFILWLGVCANAVPVIVDLQALLFETSAPVFEEHLEQQLREIVPTWTVGPVVAAYQALRGVSFLVALTFVAEVGDVRRSSTLQQLMIFLGLVPSERTTGDTVGRASITKTGNHRARRVLIEGAWTCRFSAWVGETLWGRPKDLPLNIRSIAWKAEVRLCDRRLIANGKKTPVATTAIARELAAFLWAIGQQVAPLKSAVREPSSCQTVSLSALARFRGRSLAPRGATLAGVGD